MKMPIQIYIATCQNFHSQLFQNHQQIKIILNKEGDIFTRICKIENHSNQLEYYCYNHNELYCGSCITKIKGKGIGQHMNCDICFIENHYFLFH